MKSWAAIYVLAAATMWTDAQAGTTALRRDEVTSVNGTLTYPPTFFIRFNPQSAADMVSDLPGFEIRRFGGGARGLGAGGVNVLINGAVVSGKDIDPITILQRTPAKSVERIEVTDAARLGLTGISGDVANVVIARDKPTATVIWNPIFRRAFKPALWNAEASASGSKGPWEFILGVENDVRRRGNKGLENVFDASGTVLERRDEDVQSYRNAPSLQARIGYRRENGLRANVDAKVSEFSNDFSEQRRSRFPNGIAGHRSLVSDRQGEEHEITADILFPILGGEAKLIGIDSVQNRSGTTQTREFSNLAASSATRENFKGQKSTFRRETGESILRVQISWNGTLGGNVELSAERAFNYLENDSSRLDIDEKSIAISEPISDDNTRVQEQRNEIAIAYARNFNNKLSIQSSIGVDFSTLSQPDSTRTDRTFERPKASLSATYLASPTLTYRGLVERRQGQLDFGTFVSSVNIGDQTTRAGNDEIAPSQTWFGRLEVEKKFGALSTLTGRIFAERFEDLVDEIPFDTDGDGVFDTSGPGNIAAGDRFGLDFDANLALDNIGIEGGILSLNGFLQETNVTDPVTGQQRDFSRQRIYHWSAEFERKIPGKPWEYGISIEDDRDSSEYRFNQYRREFQDALSSAYIQHQDVRGAIVTLSVSNLGNQVESEDRIVFDGPRDQSPVQFIEQRARTFGQIISLKVEKTF